jgi:hypothetical protein
MHHTTGFPIEWCVAGAQPVPPVSSETEQHGPLFFLLEENLAKSEELPTGANIAY